MNESAPPTSETRLKGQATTARIILVVALAATPFPARDSMFLTAGVLAALLLTSNWWLRLADIPAPDSPPKIGRPTSKLSIVFLIGALLLGIYLRLRLVGSTAHFSSIIYSSLPAGIASIALVWRLLHWFGFRCAALFAGFFVAIHPAWIQYDTLAAGHSPSLFFQLASITSIYLALRTLKWHYWIFFGLSISIAIHFHPGNIFFLFMTVICLSAYLIRRVRLPKTRAAAIPLLARFAVVAIVSLAATYPTLVADDLGAASKPIEQLAAKSWYHVITGSPITASAATPALAILILSPLLAIFGTIKIIRSNRYTSPMILAGIAAPILAYAVFHDQLHVANWNLSFCLPTFVLILSVGITSLSDFIPKRSIRPLATLGLGTAYLVLFSILTPGTKKAVPASNPPEKLDKS